MPKANRRANQVETPEYKFNDDATKRKIRRHIKDPHDVITDKDIKNAKVPGAETKMKPARPQTKNEEKKEELENKNRVDESPGNPVTPWDILHE